MEKSCGVVNRNTVEFTYNEDARGRGSTFTIIEISYNRTALHYINKGWEIVPNSILKNIEDYRAIHFKQTQLYYYASIFIMGVRRICG